MKILNQSFWILRILVFAIYAFAAPLGASPILGRYGAQLPADDVNVDSLLSHLLPFTRQSNKAIVLLLSGSCAEDSELISVPPILWKITKGDDPLAIVRQSLIRNPGLSIESASRRIIVVRDVSVTQQLLMTRIKRLSLTSREQYSPDAAIAAALITTDVQFALNSQNIRMASRLTGLQHVNSAKQRHLGEFSTDVSLGEFLNSVLETFGGILLYEECIDPQGRQKVDIQYYR